MLVKKRVGAFLRFLFALAVLFLQKTRQALGITFNAGEFVVRELAPGFLGFADDLFPLASEDVLINGVMLLLCSDAGVGIT